MVGFQTCVQVLGRPLIIGDIIRLPSEAQYNAKMERIEKWMEVTDVAWSTEGYSPTWQPTILRVVLSPAISSQETQDIFGDLAESFIDDLGTMSSGEGDSNSKLYQDYNNATEAIKVAANERVPESGAEGSSRIREWTQEEIDKAATAKADKRLAKIGLNSKGLYVEDGLPPNNAPYTEGPEFPDNPQNGDYHRLTYESVHVDEVAPRLYRWSQVKKRWIYLETDKRKLFNGIKPRIQDFIDEPDDHKYRHEAEQLYEHCNDDTEDSH